MTNRLRSKYKVCKSLNKNYKNLWGLAKKDSLNCLLKTKRISKRASVFGKLVSIKRCIKFFYSNIKEVTFKNYMNYSSESSTKTIDKFISILESRLDSILFRSCFVRSFHQARQLINHGYIYVNDKRVNLPDKKVFRGDIIKIKNVNLNKDLFNEIVLSRSIPDYLEVDFRSMTAIFLWDTKFSNAYYPVKAKYSMIHRLYR